MAACPSSGFFRFQPILRALGLSQAKGDNPTLLRLNSKWSPDQISNYLARCFGKGGDMSISHETIYQALYIQAKGALRQELKVEKALRSGRTGRKPQSHLPARGNRS
ncbi:hypothetical protein [Corynebacterium singulare]|uniref:hypothetical protein n=1 Tax=Corynebacterium singulare TaxID=161899 RepID=UPI0011A67D2B|nr:hypothetical protein [Corynebacterium singulare]